MKIKNLAIAAFCTIALSACSPTEDAPTVKTLQPKHGLIGKLVQVNDSLKSQYLSRGLVNEGENPTQLGDEKLVSIISADASGAVTGWRKGKGDVKARLISAGIYGVVASLIELNLNCSEIMPNPTTLTGNIEEIKKSGDLNDIEFMYKVYVYSNDLKSRSTAKMPVGILVKDSLFNTSERIAIMHNDMVGLIGNTETIAEVRNLKIDNNDAIFNILKTEESKTEYSNYVDKLIQNTSTDITNTFDNQQLAQIFKLYQEAVALCPDKANDISFIVNTYVDQILLSNELTVAERAELYPAIAVGAYSGVLWENEAKLNQKIR